MLKSNNIFFFDAIEFENIIHYYLNNGKVSLAKKAIKLGVELVDSAKGSIFNICSEQNITLKKLCGIVQREFKLKESPNFGKRPNHTWDLKYWYGNSSKAKKVLGWEPTISLETYFAQEFKKVAKDK